MPHAPDLRVDATLALETDGSFPALLCALPLLYGVGKLPAAVEVVGEARTGGLFARTLEVATCARTASRVEARLERIAPGLVPRLFRAFLSEGETAPTDILRLVVRVAARGADVAEDWRFDPARRVAQAAQRVSRERHRMEAFVRFQRHADPSGTEHFVAHVCPEVHVLPILGAHFADRYPTMRWAVVDVQRRLALVHPTPALERAPEANATQIVPAGNVAHLDATPDEAAFQDLWRTYFRAVDIAERKNLRLHQRHVPRRYWPYLTEKQVA